MSLDKQLTHHNWTKPMAHECLTTFLEKYKAKHGTALFSAITYGHVDNYIRKEAETFRRYASMWYYARIAKCQ